MIIVALPTLSCMIKTLNIASLFLGLVSFAVGSLGVLTPEIVRNLGLRLANHITSRPKDSLFFQAAYNKTVNPEIEEGDIKQWFSRCVIEFVVSMLTAVIGMVLTFVLLIGLSLWGLVYAWTAPGPHPLIWGLSVVGILISISSAASWMPKPNNPATTFGKVIRSVFRANEHLLIITKPLIWLSTKFVSIFTVTLPSWWYRSLKAVHARGFNWLFALLGLVLFIGSCALQLSAILLAP